MLIRASGTLSGGAKVDYWVRVTNAFRRSGAEWKITHEHVSLPVNMQNGQADLKAKP
jgi:ketosteroid isomerase-like protein